MQCDQPDAHDETQKLPGTIVLKYFQGSKNRLLAEQLPALELDFFYYQSLGVPVIENEYIWE